MPTPTRTSPRCESDAPPQTPGARRWSEVLRDPQFNDLPYKIETNARGQLVLSPQKHDHSFSQYRIGRLIEEQMKKHEDHTGRVGVEFALHTTDGVKVPDVIWISEECARQIPDDAEASLVAPEICVEVLSESNTEAEMNEKRRLFFEAGAAEVWLVERSGSVRFFDADGERERSSLAPEFPERVEAK